MIWLAAQWHACYHKPLHVLYLFTFLFFWTINSSAWPLPAWSQRSDFHRRMLWKDTTTLDKKKNHLRDSRREERCSIVWYHARWRTINAGQKSRTVAVDFALHWSCVIEQDITRSNSVLLAANLGNGSFFLSRVVQHTFVLEFTWILHDTLLRIPVIVRGSLQILVILYSIL